ncbi:MAG: sulfatase [Planctomycetes bacterium]|nr:sulfatase [Planctomycetota bacterium]
MKRRDFLKTFGIVAAGGYLLSNRSLDVRSGPEQPNVLFIAIDDLNDWIGCMGGHPDAKTPNLDRLAKRGVLFTSAHCAAPACNPSRAALMTGILPSTSGVYDNKDRWRDFLPEAQTIPMYFMEHGYHSIGRGKIYHGPYTDTHPNAWDEYTPKGPDLPAQTDHPRYGTASTFSWGPIVAAEEEMDDYKVASWTIEKLQQDHDKPFFIACGLYKPHVKWHVPEKYFDMYPPESVTLPTVNLNDLDDIPPEGVKIAAPDGKYGDVMAADAWRDTVAAYLANISFTDAQLGRVLDALDESKYKDNTIVILWGDHGWHLGEKLHYAKFTPWEEATKAPLFFSVPGLTRPGNKCYRPVSFMDIYPTLLELCSLPPKDDNDGRSIIPLLKNPEAEWNYPALSTRNRNNHALRDQRWRYIRYHDGGEELYDHDSDEMEWTNLLWGDNINPEHRAIADEMAKWLPKINHL